MLQIGAKHLSSPACEEPAASAPISIVLDCDHDVSGSVKRGGCFLGSYRSSNSMGRHRAALAALHVIAKVAQLNK